MKALILGGNGFLGAHLQKLFGGSEHSLRVLDHSPARYFKPLPFCEYLTGDWSDGKLLDRALEGVDCVFHLIGTVQVRLANENPALDAEKTILGSLKLLDACVKKSVKTFVFVSSGGAVYGGSSSVISETHPTEPISAHGVSKLAVEKYLNLYDKLHGLRYRIARCSNPYGEYQDPCRQQGVILALLYETLKGGKLPVWGDGSVVRDYIYAGDAARALYLMGLSNSSSSVFNVSSGIGTSINELKKIAREITNRECVFETLPARPYDVPKNVLDPSKARSQLAWAPSVSLKEGMERTYLWLLDFYKTGREDPR